MTAETLTLTAAATAARALGYTIRRTVDSEVVAYRKGEGVNSPAAYFTDDPADALATVQEMHRRDMLAADAAALDPADAAKAAAESIAAAETEVERRDLLAAALHFGRAAAMTRRTVALYAGHGKRGQVQDRAAAYDKRAFELRREHAERARRAAARKEAREAGHACEDRADALTGEARARELDREEVAAIRQGIETRKRAPQRPEEGRRVVDMTPTWAGLAPALFLALTNGTPEGQRIAREELTRALAALDAHNAAAKAAAKPAPIVPEDRREDLLQCLDRASYGNLQDFAFAVLAHGQDAAESAEDNLPHFARHIATA